MVNGTVAREVQAATHLEEATFVRWRHVLEHAIYIPGTKSHNSPRWVPHQDALKPWIHILRELADGDPDPDDFVLRLRRDGDRGKPPSAKTWAGRIAQIEVEARLKVPGKRAHILRATHISYAKDVLPTAAPKAYAGHAQPFGGATDDYVDTRPPFIPRAHRHYLRLPTPAASLHLRSRTCAGGEPVREARGPPLCDRRLRGGLRDLATDGRRGGQRRFWRRFATRFATSALRRPSISRYQSTSLLPPRLAPSTLSHVPAYHS